MVLQTRGDAAPSPPRLTDLEDDGFQEGDDALAESEKKMLNLELTRMANPNVPAVPDFPAPPSTPPHTAKKVPSALVKPPAETAIDRILNSSAGRSFLYVLTVIVFLITCFGVVNWNAPENRLDNTAMVHLGWAVGFIAFMYTVVPQMAKRAGLGTNEWGVDFKPYLVFYRLSYLTAIPAFLFLSFGFGSKISFGESEGGAGSVRMEDLGIGTLKYFEAADGFVALNLTKGIVETLGPQEHGDERALRKSRFRDAELRVNTEPYSDEVEPTKPPGALRVSHIAPIFAEWGACLSRYRISITCLRQNPVIGWAIAGTSSICSNMRIVACRPPEPELNPVYKCSSSDPLFGKQLTGSEALGLCGRVVMSPDEALLDELRALLLWDGWPTFALPNETHVWVDVWPDDCIAHPDVCGMEWDIIGSVGLMFLLITVLCIIVPGIIDCVVDKRIREATAFYEYNQNKNNRKALGLL